MGTHTSTNRASRLLPGVGLIGALALGAGAGHAQEAQDDTAAAPEAVGAVAACAVCHGPEGGGRSRLEAPRIGGLPAWYLERQLENFAQGIRGGSEEDVYGSQMHAIALMLDGEQVIADLAEHFASLSPEWPEQTVSGDAERGEQLYSVCAACHGEQGRGGEQLNTPTMVGMSDWYLLRQLEYFNNGVRGSHPDDTFGAQMVPIMAMFDDREDLVDIVAYINTFSEAGAPASND